LYVSYANEDEWDASTGIDCTDTTFSETVPVENSLAPDNQKAVDSDMMIDNNSRDVAVSQSTSASHYLQIWVNIISDYQLD